MQHFAEPKHAATERADTTTEDLDMAADHLAGTAAHQLQEADILIAQLGTTHTASTDIDKAPNHITSALLPLQDPMQHQTLKQMRIKQNPEEDSHPHVQEIYTTESESDLDTNDTKSEISFTVHSQDEGSLSTDDTTPKTFHRPMTPPPRTLNEPLTGSLKMNTNNDNIAANTHQQPKQPTQ